MEQKFYNNSIFHIETEKIRPNPYQPRREFDENKLNELAESIRQYGVLQPIVVTRHEFEKDEGGLGVDYEVIAGERRLRASRIAGLLQIPAVIRAAEDDDRMKLELAIIENLQREDLNPIDRALAFKKLADEFGFKHNEIAKKVGKSREYISNSIRLLLLPQEIISALANKKIMEGHARTLIMLTDRPAEQSTLFKEILFKRITVREAEGIARRIAYEKVRKHNLDPELIELEEDLTEALGTRVRIDKRNIGGRVTIEFFSDDDLRNLLASVKKRPISITESQPLREENSFVESVSDEDEQNETPYDNNSDDEIRNDKQSEQYTEPDETVPENTTSDIGSESEEDITNDDDLYSVKNFSI